MSTTTSDLKTLKQETMQAILQKILDSKDSVTPESVLAYANAYAVLESGQPRTDPSMHLRIR
jgi:hypothetical protein